MADRVEPTLQTNDVPVLNVTLPDDDQPSPNQSPSSPTSPTQHGLLSPNSPANHHRSSLDVPASPTPTIAPSNDGSVPPSPTLSNHSSVHWNSSLALRDNKPDAASGMDSAGLLNTNDQGHHRRPSNATIVESETSDTGHQRGDSLTHVKSNTTSFTHVDPSSKRAGSDMEKEKGKKKKSGKEKDDDEREAERLRTLEQDLNFDPTPFEFKPHALAHLLDPKSFETLASFGGTRGLLRGLGVDRKQGLSHQSLKRQTTKASQLEKRGASEAPSTSHDLEKGEVPGITITEPDSEEKRAISAHDANGGDDDDHSSDAYKATLEDRRRIYGENHLPQRASKTLLQLMWTALKDKVLILLSVAAVVSLALGLFQDFGPPSRNSDEPPVDWVEGVAIVVAILIVVMVGSVNDWQKERQFKALNEKKEERGVKVIRDGVERVIDIKEVVVGDIALLEPGEIIPCDGIFLGGHNVRCDESGATGESDAIKKISFEEWETIRQKALDDGEGDLHNKPGFDHALAHTDCFIISGSKVLEGVGSYVVVAVGQKSFNGRIMLALRGDTENTPLQVKLNYLAELIAKIGAAAGCLLFTALMIRFFVQLGTKNPPRTPEQHGTAFVNILIISVTLIVVAVPEGLPLAVTIALAFATKRMTYEKLLVRVLGSCETMANASVVCTDKTGTLTQNDMTVVAGSVGIHCKFVRQLEENQARTNADESSDPESKSTGARKNPDDFSVDQAHLSGVLSPQLQDLFNSAIAINSTAFEDENPETNEIELVGSKTETALIKFTKELQWPHFKKIRDSAEVVQMIPFSSERKAMGVVVRLDRNRCRLFLKGASEILSKKCTRHVVVSQNGQASSSDSVETREIGKAEEENISRTIIFYANQTLRTIALCYRDFDSWPPPGSHYDSPDEVDPNDLFQDLTLIAITGIEDPLREGVREAVAKCQNAGVQVKMCTGDNVLTARSIALQCGIFTPGGIIMEGPDFRQLSRTEMLERVPRLQVLARSSPEDKKILVEALKSLGEIVGVTGDGTNDGPALKTANVGFSMGIAGTEVAKEASDIILMDDNFASIVKAIIWGRCVNDAVRKFLQFQISTNVTAVIITFVTAVSSVHEESVLTAVQLLWINIIMDTFAALALATDPASEALLDRKPDKKTAPLFSVNMLKMILIQSTYQTIIILIFHFLGIRILGFQRTNDTRANEHQDAVIQTLVFNAFVFAQIFNSVNCRRLDRKLNIFEGMRRNWYFIVITLIEIVIQVIIVFVGGAAFQVTRIAGREWGISLALGVVSIPLGVVVRLLPNEPFEKLFRALGLLGKNTPDVLPTTNPDSEWNSAITRVRDNLATFSNLRGGRVRSSSFVVKSRSARISADQERVPLPSLLTMAPSLMISTIGAGWAPQVGSLSDPANSDPSKSSTALWEGRAQIHPDTDPNDPVRQKFAQYQNQSSSNSNQDAAP